MRRLPGRGNLEPFIRKTTDTFLFGAYEDVPAIDAAYREDEERYCPERIAACFLGNKAEREDLLVRCLYDAVYQLSKGRRLFYPKDPTPVTPEVEASEAFQKMTHRIQESAAELTHFLNHYSLPFFSMRYQGHMNWDVTLPAIIGYFTAMIQNSNNVSVQGSTATTLIERMVGLDLCGMIGYDLDGEIAPWAHITCDGTVANLESVWSTRELKYFAIAVRDAIYDALEGTYPGRYPEGVRDVLIAAADLPIPTPDRRTFTMRDPEVDGWFLLNLDSDTILSLPDRMVEHHGAADGAEDLGKLKERVWELLLQEYTLAVRGYLPFCRQLVRDRVEMPVVVVPSSKHYSWPKATSVLGLGYQTGPLPSGLLNVFVDADGRMDLERLRETLEDCRSRRIPVLEVVAVMGSTEESAVDPLTEILGERDRCRRREDFMDFNVHADAAWGGYLLTALRVPYKMPLSIPDLPEEKDRPPAVAAEELFNSRGVLLSEHTIRHLEALRHCDSITIDPHKWGYVPYPAGSLAYRNGRMTNLVTFGAPYIGSEKGGTEAISIGESGIEGSKPGAAPAAVYLSHRVLRPDRSGYGQLMHGALFNARMFSLHLLRLAKDCEAGLWDFRPYLLGERHLTEEFWRHPLIAAFMTHHVSDPEFVGQVSRPEHRDLIRDVGPDMSTLAYAFNHRDNTELRVANALNKRMFEKYLYPNPEGDDVIPIDRFELFVTKTTFRWIDYGPSYLQAFAEGLGVEIPTVHAGDADPEIECLRSVVMDPWTATTLGEPADFFGETLIPALRDATEKAWRDLVNQP